MSRDSWAWLSEEDGKWHLSVKKNRERPWNTYDTKEELADQARKRDLNVIWEK